LLGVLDELLDERAGVDDPVLAQLLGGDLAVVELLHRLGERVQVGIPALGVDERLDRTPDHLFDPALDLVGEVLALEHPPALLVDDDALLVHHVVVLEDVLPRDEVLLLDLLLCVLDLLREEFRLHRLVVRNLETLDDPIDPIAGEQTHEVVLGGQVETRLAGIALTAGAAAELVVDPSRLVPLGAEHVEAAQVDDAVAELDVDAAAGHVRRDRDRADLPGVLDDLRLARVLLRVQDVVLDPGARQPLRQMLGGLDRDRADEDRLPLLVTLLDVFDHGGELAVDRLVDEVVLVVARDRLVGRDLDHVRAVDLDELLLLGLRGAGHPGQLVVEPEVVLQGDGRQGDVLFLDADTLLGLDRLVETLRPAAPFHDPAGELVDDLHLTVLNDVVVVALVERLRLQRLVQVVDELDVARVVEVLDSQRPFELLDRGLERRHRLELLVVEEVGSLRDVQLDGAAAG